jgi:hypothetical protein
MGQEVVFNYHMLSTKVPTTHVTQDKYPMGHHSHSFVIENGRKRFLSSSLTEQSIQLFLAVAAAAAATTAASARAAEAAAVIVKAEN